MTRVPPGRVLAALFALLVVSSAAVAGVAADHDDSVGDGTDRPTPADEIFVEEGGDAVLVYEGEGSSANRPARADFGVDVGSSLFHALVTDPVEGTPSVRGDASLSVVPPTIAGSGSLSTPAPDAIESFSLSLSGERTAEDARADGDLALTVDGGGMLAQLLQSASTTGSVTTSADRFQATGEVRASIPIGAGPSSEQSYALSGTDGTYTLEVEQSRLLTDPDRSGPVDREAARQTLEQTFGSVARDLHGDATVTIEEFQREETGDGERVDLAFTVTYEGVGSGLEARLGEELAESPDLDDEQAAGLAEDVLAVEIERAGLTIDKGAGSYEYAVDLDVRDYADLARSYFELAREAAPEGTDPAEIERSQARFEASQAADLEREFSWEGSVSHPDETSTAVDLQFQARTSNFGDYVDELEARDLPTPASSYELTGDLDGDRLALDGQFRSNNPATVENLAGQYAAALEETDGDAEMRDAIDEAGFERARLEASYDSDGLRLEAAVGLSDLEALRDAVAQRDDVPRISGVIGRFGEDDEGATYVRVDGVVEGDASEADVRALPYVTDDTTVHLPGEWDREFPAMDTERAESFLDEADAAVDADDGAGVAGPGFGALAAVLALLTGAALLARRD